ncbi:probable sodium/potassium-transporting ATPase subunit beta-3 [Battus philenor]|uniref:probable sodium/potassium-transporting ATPase subunit beta-3 n=1 Tax=Battus philenor TaxID=42288 RepID=UPI0035CFA23A
MGSKEPNIVKDKAKAISLSPSKDYTPPTTSRDTGHVIVKKDQSKIQTPWYRKLCNYCYNRDQKTLCGRPTSSWLYIIAYSIIYFLFLCTYTMIFLYATLTIIKMKGDYHLVDKAELLTYAQHGIGLSATPCDVNNLPLIWYKDRDAKDYQKYVKAIDDLLSDNRRKRHANQSDLGPCGQQPYGYGEKPCIIIRINKQLGWSVKPIDENSVNIKDVPVQLKQLLKTDKRKLILNCDGYHKYDKEHIGKIAYFPDPPGFDASIFPLDIEKSSPLIAIQISDFTLGLSIAVECKLYYDGGTSSVQFVIYVTPNNTNV